MHSNRKLVIVRNARTDGDDEISRVRAKVSVGVSAPTEVGAIGGTGTAVVAALALAGAGFGLILSGGSVALAGIGLLAGGAIGYGLARDASGA